MNLVKVHCTQVWKPLLNFINIEIGAINTNKENAGENSGLESERSLSFSELTDLVDPAWDFK